ncbi:MAG: 2-succinyl-5-enolpyruvyl-6-hydroxy-3-cyclohexene-1-carboxylic-acid synthase [Cytophagaceae bacterium]|nr:2-succinyl-5-enolpyruvyl-6-hydroxy-3-cyclohexene-1-carboxylic-acid synthase [Cytophagaceae bacterium]
MAVIQPILDLVEVCVQQGLRHAIISPGSRSAALTLAFARHPRIQTYVIPDERTAGYIGLGMAQALGEPVALVCTSGTAAINFAPAVAEAYFYEIPLLVLTADRPPEWIHQQDGQTVYQQGLYGRHVKQFHQLPADYLHPDSAWFVNRIINQSFIVLTNKPLGPVHINVPIREPFYPKPEEPYVFNPEVRVVRQSAVQKTISSETWAELLDELEDADRVLIAAGQGKMGEDLTRSLRALQDEFYLPTSGDLISNLPGNDAFITSLDVILGQENKEVLQALQPDLLITFGNSFLSKNFKTFLRTNQVRQHWHLRIADELIDPFQSVTRVLPVEPDYFFRQLVEDLDLRRFRSGDEEDRDGTYLETWLTQERKARRLVNTFLPAQRDFNEFTAVHDLLHRLPDHGQLHLANSMSVRYANYVGLPANRVAVFSNRGTSGIDGCLSTAVGAALTTDQLVFLLIGDVAFFYDRNALWHPHVPRNLRIVLLNNHGGGIFRLIDGPGSLPERTDFFETPHQTNAKNTAAEAGLSYFICRSMSELQGQWTEFAAESDQSKILEIETDGAMNEAVFAKFKELVAAG